MNMKFFMPRNASVCVYKYIYIYIYIKFDVNRIYNQPVSIVNGAIIYIWFQNSVSLWV